MARLTYKFEFDPDPVNMLGDMRLRLVSTSVSGIFADCYRLGAIRFKRMALIKAPLRFDRVFSLRLDGDKQVYVDFLEIVGIIEEMNAFVASIESNRHDVEVMEFGRPEHVNGSDSVIRFSKIKPFQKIVSEG